MCTANTTERAAVHHSGLPLCKSLHYEGASTFDALLDSDKVVSSDITLACNGNDATAGSDFIDFSFFEGFSAR